MLEQEDSGIITNSYHLSKPITTFNNIKMHC